MKKQKLAGSSRSLELSQALAKEHLAVTGLNFKGVSASSELLTRFQDAVDQAQKSTSRFAMTSVRKLAK